MLVSRFGQLWQGVFYVGLIQGVDCQPYLVNPQIIKIKVKKYNHKDLCRVIFCVVQHAPSHLKLVKNTLSLVLDMKNECIIFCVVYWFVKHNKNTGGLRE
eukprot:TRINITY_DN48858_c0_g4_i1.p3 TRINITY_DN48858_c0_g4~~TRINITY_DN48858_c0_g4_i1.p3  ORF type:complete len:100 (+),score=0.70 TRINITY_DN48858_c0_g4_i1:126-425(+)